MTFYLPAAMLFIPRCSYCSLLSLIFKSSVKVFPAGYHWFPDRGHVLNPISKNLPNASEDLPLPTLLSMLKHSLAKGIFHRDTGLIELQDGGAHFWGLESDGNLPRAQNGHSSHRDRVSHPHLILTHHSCCLCSPKRHRPPWRSIPPSKC